MSKAEALERRTEKCMPLGIKKEQRVSEAKYEALREKYPSHWFARDRSNGVYYHCKNHDRLVRYLIDIRNFRAEIIEPLRNPSDFSSKQDN